MHFSSDATSSPSSLFFFFTAPAPTDTYTLSLHDALPICLRLRPGALRELRAPAPLPADDVEGGPQHGAGVRARSEEHTSELQSHHDLVCRLLLEKKNKQQYQKQPLKIARNIARATHVHYW